MGFQRFAEARSFFISAISTAFITLSGSGFVLRNNRFLKQASALIRPPVLCQITQSLQGLYQDRTLYWFLLVVTIARV